MHKYIWRFKEFKANCMEQYIIANDVISRSQAVDAISKMADEWEENGMIPQCQGLRTAAPILEKLPSISSQIIRCIDCKHYWIHKCMDSMPIERCDLDQLFYNANIDFCSQAERREVSDE